MYYIFNTVYDKWLHVPTGLHFERFLHPVSGCWIGMASTEADDIVDQLGDVSGIEILTEEEFLNLVNIKTISVDDPIIPMTVLEEEPSLGKAKSKKNELVNLPPPPPSG